MDGPDAGQEQDIVRPPLRTGVLYWEVRRVLVQGAGDQTAAPPFLFGMPGCIASALFQELTCAERKGAGRGSNVRSSVGCHVGSR